METWVSDFLTSAPIPLTVVSDSDFGLTTEPRSRRNLVLMPEETFSAFGSAVTTARTAARLAAKTGNLVVSHQPLIGLLLVFLGAGRQLVHVIHNDFERQSRLARGPSKRIALWVLERILIKNCLGVICSCGHYYQKLRSLHGQLFRAGAFVDQTIFRPRGKSRSGILWVGRMERVKNPELALDAFLAGAQKHRQEITFVGSGPLKRVLTERLEKSSFKHLVSFRDALDREQLAAMMAVKKVFLSTSQSEGHPRALLEAIASGLNVVSVPAADPEGLVQSMGVGVVVDGGAHKIGDAIYDQLKAPVPEVPDLRTRSPEAIASKLCGWLEELSARRTA